MVAAHLSADNQPKYDPEEFDLAMRKIDVWRERLAWLKLVWLKPRGDAEPSTKSDIATRTT
jgi:hypothetical protein